MIATKLVWLNKKWNKNKDEYIVYKSMIKVHSICGSFCHIEVKI